MLAIDKLARFGTKVSVQEPLPATAPPRPRIDGSEKPEFTGN
jgi:hypothetical protein